MSVSRASLAAAAFSTMPCEAAVIDQDGTILLVNEAWRAYGRANGAGALCGPGANYLRVCERSAAAGDDVAEAVTAALTSVIGGDAPGAELDYPCHSPEERRWFRLRAHPLPGTSRVLVLHDEVSRHIEEAADLRHQATHDPLTGLANRVVLLDRLTSALRVPDARHPLVAVLVADLDGFKEVNDTWGHVTGDVLLQVVGRRLAGLVREGDTAVRWGGDEFVLVLPGCSREQASRLCHRLTSAVAEPVRVGGLELHVTVTVGMGLARPGMRPEELLDRADASLRRAKSRRP